MGCSPRGRKVGHDWAISLPFFLSSSQSIAVVWHHHFLETFFESTPAHLSTMPLFIPLY